MLPFGPIPKTWEPCHNVGFLSAFYICFYYRLLCFFLTPVFSLEEKGKPQDSGMQSLLQVMPNDVVVLGSDGLFDNVTPDQILEDVRAHIGEHKHPSAIAQHLVTLAYNNSMDKDQDTPYSLAATEAFDMIYSGGKPDDITVVVAELR